MKIKGKEWRERASRLKAWRKDKVDQWGRGMTQPTAAEWYGVHERTWRRWETGEIRVPEHVMRRTEA